MIYGYHVHIYFDASTLERARQLVTRVQQHFGLRAGPLRQQPVGPHPEWSCQLNLPPQQFADVIPWLALHRKGLTIFTHPVTGDDYRDHSDHAIWMGAMPQLNLGIFKTHQEK